VAEEHRSGLSEDEVEELARKVMGVICREWPKLRAVWIALSSIPG
jgi:hypothetical protein